MLAPKYAILSPKHKNVSLALNNGVDRKAGDIADRLKRIRSSYETLDHERAIAASKSNIMRKLKDSEAHQSTNLTGNTNCYSMLYQQRHSESLERRIQNSEKNLDRILDGKVLENKIMTFQTLNSSSNRMKSDSAKRSTDIFHRPHTNNSRSINHTPNKTPAAGSISQALRNEIEGQRANEIRRIKSPPQVSAALRTDIGIGNIAHLPADLTARQMKVPIVERSQQEPQKATNTFFLNQFKDFRDRTSPTDVPRTSAPGLNSIDGRIHYSRDTANADPPRLSNQSMFQSSKPLQAEMSDRNILSLRTKLSHSINRIGQRDAAGDGTTGGAMPSSRREYHELMHILRTGRFNEGLVGEVVERLVHYKQAFEDAKLTYLKQLDAGKSADPRKRTDAPYQTVEKPIKDQPPAKPQITQQVSQVPKQQVANPATPKAGKATDQQAKGAISAGRSGKKPQEPSTARVSGAENILSKKVSKSVVEHPADNADEMSLEDLGTHDV